MTPDSVYLLLEEHKRCQCLVYFFQTQRTGKPVHEDTRILLRRVEKMDRILKLLTLKKKV